MRERIRRDLPRPPQRIAALEVDHRGYPVPFFVAYVDDKPDFRVVDPAKWTMCVKRRLCWVCGGPLGVYLAFLIGPMCAINRVSSEPPSHRECAEWSARACPFLSHPKAKRREANLPEGGINPGGIMIERNPGVTLLWITRSYKPFRVPDGGALIDIGPPLEVAWYAEGRIATRAEIMASIDTGLPLLQREAERDGAHAIAELAQRYTQALELVPAA